MMPEEFPHDSDRVWQALAAAARRAADEPPMPLDADLVLRARRAGPSRRENHDQQRLVSWAALIAVAASLLVTVISWSDVVAAWSPEPAIFELPVPLEPVE